MLAATPHVYGVPGWSSVTVRLPPVVMEMVVVMVERPEKEGVQVMVNPTSTPFRSSSDGDSNVKNAEVELTTAPVTLAGAADGAEKEERTTKRHSEVTSEIHM